jgi:hypothetical protein
MERIDRWFEGAYGHGTACLATKDNAPLRWHRGPRTRPPNPWPSNQKIREERVLSLPQAKPQTDEWMRAVSNYDHKATIVLVLQPLQRDIDTSYAPIADGVSGEDLRRAGALP